MHCMQLAADMYTFFEAAALAQSVRAFASHAEGWVFESQPPQAQLVKTDSDISTAKRSATGVSVTGPRR